MKLRKKENYKKVLLLFVVGVYGFLMGCTNQKEKKKECKECDLLFLNYLLNKGNVIFERNDNFLSGRNLSRLYGLDLSSYGDGVSDGYIDNFLTPSGIYLIVRDVVGWKSPENGGVPYGEENFWNADYKGDFFNLPYGINRQAIGVYINLKSNYDRSWFNYELRSLNSSYDRIGFILAAIRYLFPFGKVLDHRLRVIYLNLLTYEFPIYKYRPEEMESKLNTNKIPNVDFTWYDYFVENVGLVEANTNIEISSKCDRMIEEGFIWERDGGGYNCIVDEEHDPYSIKPRALNFSALRLDLTQPFMKPECRADIYVDGGICTLLEIEKRGEGSQYVKASKVIETIGGEENPDIREYIKNKNGLVILKIPEEDRKNLDKSNKQIIFEVDAANIFFWDSEAARTGFDPSIDRPNPSIGKDLKIYLPRIKVRVE